MTAFFHIFSNSLFTIILPFNGSESERIIKQTINNHVSEMIPPLQRKGKEGRITTYLNYEIGIV
jgi:hypothetical protein